jgi:hypothetical protein
MAVTALLANLQKQAKVRVAETRKLEDGTEVRILVGTLPVFPHGKRPTWYPLVLRPGQTEVDRREVEAILRHFWNAQLDFFSGKVVKHSKSALKRK